MQKVNTKDDVIKIIKNEFPYLHKKYGITKIAIFGSFAKGSAKRMSDVDILVKLGKPLGLEFVGLADYLEKVLGRKVDIATFDCWKRSLDNPRYRAITENVGRDLLYV